MRRCSSAPPAQPLSPSSKPPALGGTQEPLASPDCRCIHLSTTIFWCACYFYGAPPMLVLRHCTCVLRSPQTQLLWVVVNNSRTEIIPNIITQQRLLSKLTAPHPAWAIMRSTHDLLTEFGRTKVPQNFNPQGSHPPPQNPPQAPPLF